MAFCLVAAAMARRNHPSRLVAVVASTPSDSSSNLRMQRCKTTAIYCLGQGWTGALGTGRLDQNIAGHSDHETDEAHAPVLMFETRHSILSVAVGWGHTAFVVQEAENKADDADNTMPVTSSNDVATHDAPRFTQLYITGRPHEFASLLKLFRLPAWFRQYAVRRTYITTNEKETDLGSFHPVDLVGRLVTWLAKVFQVESQDWELARGTSFIIAPALVESLPHWDNTPLQVDCNAGITAVTTPRTVYTFGLNGFGQCGVGSTSNNVWIPSPVTGLSSEFAPGQRVDLPQSHPIRHVALGLQHGLCLNDAGEIFGWGKNENGQIGHQSVGEESHTAMPILKGLKVKKREGLRGKPVYHRLGKMSQVCAGMIHSAALEEETSDVYIWGKNTIPDEKQDSRKIASDARMPVRLDGLPENSTVQQIACGSHHTAMLMDDGSVWAVGIASDTRKPLLDPVCLMEAGTFDLPIVQFTAHMDRTTVITDTQILQVHLWETEEKRENSVFTPAWADKLLESDPDVRIRQVCRSWLHTVIVTEKD